MKDMVTDERLIEWFNNLHKWNIIQQHKFIDADSFTPWLSVVVEDKETKQTAVMQYSVEQALRVKPLVKKTNVL